MQDDSISVPPFEVSRILPRYKHSRKRLILVDFEDTLWSRDLSRAGLVAMAQGDYIFPEDAVSVLGKLAEDVRNEVWLLSGLRVDGILQRIKDKVPKVGIVYVFLFYQDGLGTYERSFIVQRTDVSSKHGLLALILENGSIWYRILI